MTASRTFLDLLLGTPRARTKGVVTKGVALVWGIPENIKPIHGLPGGSSKLVLEKDSYAKVVFLGPTADRTYTLEDRGDFWIPHVEVKREIAL